MNDNRVPNYSVQIWGAYYRHQKQKLNQSAADNYQSMKGRDITTAFLWLSVIMGASARVVDEVAAEGAFTTEMPDFGECPPFRQIHDCRFPLFPGCQDCPGIPFPCNEKWISVDGPKCYYVSTIDPPRYVSRNMQIYRKFHGQINIKLVKLIRGPPKAAREV